MIHAIVDSNNNFIKTVNDADGNVWWNATNFCTPSALTPDQMIEFGVQPYLELGQPAINPLTETVSPATPILINGVWNQQWVVTTLAVPLPTPVPQSVSPFQAKAALLNAGLLTNIQTYMTTSATPIEQLAWNECTQFDRQSPTIASLMTLLNLTEAQVDQLFIAAAQIIS